MLLVFPLFAGTLVATGYPLRHEQAQGRPRRAAGRDGDRAVHHAVRPGARTAEVLSVGGAGMYATRVAVWTRRDLPAPERGESILPPDGSISVIVARTGTQARADGGSCSAVAVPVMVDGAPWGSLCMTSAHPAPLSPASEALLARLAEPAALSMMPAGAAREQMATLALTDHLTGLWSRRAFQERLAAELERARRYDRPRGRGGRLRRRRGVRMDPPRDRRRRGRRSG